MYLQITAFSAGAFIGKVLGQPNHATSQEATLHYVKGVRILRERLLLRDEEGKGVRCYGFRDLDFGQLCIRHEQVRKLQSCI